jgi:hypothetical protein
MPKDIPDHSPILDKAARSESVLPAPIVDAPASEADIEAFKSSVLAKLALAVGKDGDAATPRDWFVATALALRDRVIHRWLAVNRASHAEGKKHVYDRDGARGARRSWRRSRPDAPGGTRRRAGQWRPRPARRLPDGEHGEPWGAGLRLRHPL